MKLLTICPSRNRPELCRRMIDSFEATKAQPDTEILVYISHDDPQLTKYEELLKDKLHIVGQRRHLVKVLNYISCEVYPGIEYYQEINDDHIFRTSAWDRELINTIETKGKGWGISFGNDLMTNEPWEIARHPSGAVISGNIVRTLKCFILPELDHLFTDTYLRDIGEGINAYFRREDIIIEHCHLVSKKAQIDDNYRYVYNPRTFQQGLRIYGDWHRNESKLYLQKIIEARERELQTRYLPERVRS